MKRTPEPELLPPDPQPTFQPAKMPNIEPSTTELARFEGGGAVEQRAPVSALSILEAAIHGGINKDNVEVVERLVALRREELAEESKRAFAKAFFQLRKSMPELYADKSAKLKNGNVAYTYCSEEEISRMLEPHLFRHGFTMLFGQRQADARNVAVVTLIHEGGHQETREFSVRSGNTNDMKDATSADAGSTTTAWRHLMIKMFGLKSRISQQDARLEGATVTPEQAFEIERRVKETNSDVQKFLRLAGVDSFDKMPIAKYEVLSQLLAQKERLGK